MKHDDAFYRAFRDELEKEAWIPQALALGARVGGAILGAGKAAGAGARVAGAAAGKAGGGLVSKLKGAAGTAASYAPSFLGGGGQKQKKSNTYV
ncbi:MAG TPA: hypothetical protein VFI02_18615 [Armatimonadota bacterium]|nr:hypothetical protein [Armatimonadota bacterium]